MRKVSYIITVEEDGNIEEIEILETSDEIIEI